MAEMKKKVAGIELINSDGSPLNFPTQAQEQEKSKVPSKEDFELPYPVLIGDTILLHEQHIESEEKTVSGLITNPGGKKTLFYVKAVSPDMKASPFEVGDYVEAFVMNGKYSTFTGFDNEKYVIVATDTVVGYYPRKKEGK